MAARFTNALTSVAAPMSSTHYPNSATWWPPMTASVLSRKPGREHARHQPGGRRQLVVPQRPGVVRHRRGPRQRRAHATADNPVTETGVFSELSRTASAGASAREPIWRTRSAIRSSSPAGGWRRSAASPTSAWRRWGERSGGTCAPPWTRARAAILRAGPASSCSLGQDRVELRVS